MYQLASFYTVTITSFILPHSATCDNPKSALRYDITLVNYFKVLVASFTSSNFSVSNLARIMASYPKEMTDPTRRSTVIGLNGEEKVKLLCLSLLVYYRTNQISILIFFQLNWFTASIKEALSLHYKNGPYPFLAIVTSVEASDPDCEGLVKMTEDYQDEIRKSIMKNPKLMPRGIRIVILNEQNQHKCQDSNKVKFVFFSVSIQVSNISQFPPRRLQLLLSEIGAASSLRTRMKNGVVVYTLDSTQS